MGSRTFIDGVWAWPEGFAHYIKKHNVTLPREFIDYARSQDWLIPRELISDPKEYTINYEFWIDWSKSFNPQFEKLKEGESPLLKFFRPILNLRR